MPAASDDGVYWYNTGGVWFFLLGSTSWPTKAAIQNKPRSKPMTRYHSHCREASMQHRVEYSDSIYGMKRWVFGATVGLEARSCFSHRVVVCLSESRHSDLQLRHVATCRSASDVSPEFVVEPILFMRYFLLDTWITHSSDMLTSWIKKPKQRAAASSSSSSAEAPSPKNPTTNPRSSNVSPELTRGSRETNSTLKQKYHQHQADNCVQPCKGIRRKRAYPCTDDVHKRV